MTFPAPRLTITAKLALSVLVFILIFYGTIVYVFLRIQTMMNISEEIVNINNVASTQIKILIENLLEMDGNAKKYSLLGKEVYRQSFDSSKERFDTALSTIQHLSARGYEFPASFSSLFQEYDHHYQNLLQEGTEIRWVDEDTVNTWLALLVSFRDTNQEQIEQSMMQIHELAFRSTRNGLLGYGLSVVVAFLGILFVSKSIIIPLRQLTHGLRTISRGDFNHQITVSSKDEFYDLAMAFNEMNRELQEEESLRADFIATLSHEIKTPLASVQESVNMMAEEVLGPVNEKQRKFLSIAGSEIGRINEMLNLLLHVSKLEAGSSSVLGQRVYVADVIESSTASLQAMASLKEITFDVTIDKNLQQVTGVRDEIQQVLMNIIGNGIKFSPAHSVLRITVLKDEKSGYAQFCIQDEGPGIADDELSMIFHKYYRSKVVREHTDGVGLGLYISRRLIQNMGGNISVHNNTDKGATFVFTLPQAR